MFVDSRFKNYSLAKWKKDVLSGIIVGIIAIPLGMAFAIASGVKPEYGIYTTIIAGLFVSLFGGSKFQIAGPTGAFIPLLFGIVATYGYEGLLISGFMAGFILVLMGIFKLGVLIKYIPRPVIIGFTSGIAIIIFTGQISNFLGLEGVKSQEFFHENMYEITTHLNTVNFVSILIALICLIALIMTPKFFPKVPGPLVGIVICTVIASVFFEGSLPTIGSAYGAIPSGLPSFSFPSTNIAEIISLIRPAFTIAMLCAIESLLSAVVADGMTNTKHDSNKELVGQGIANMVTPLFGGIPATGAIARTATNIKTGAVSPVSGIVHAVVVLITLVIFAPYASAIPLASLAPVLMLVAWNMSERKEFIAILKTRSADAIVLVITFALTVLVDLTVAVEVGLLLAMILFVKRMSEVFQVKHVLPEDMSTKGRMTADAVSDSHFCPQMNIFEIEGSLFFGAAETFVNRVLHSIDLKPKVLLLKMNKVVYLDTTGENHLKDIVKQLQKKNCVVLISGMKEQPLDLIKRTGLYERIGENHFFDHTEEAIHSGLTHIDKDKCSGCRYFAFQECEELSATQQKQTH